MHFKTYRHRLFLSQSHSFACLFSSICLMIEFTFECIKIEFTNLDLAMFFFLLTDAALLIFLMFHLSERRHHFQSNGILRFLINPINSLIINVISQKCSCTNCGDSIKLQRLRSHNTSSFTLIYSPNDVINSAEIHWNSMTKWNDVDVFFFKSVMNTIFCVCWATIEFLLCGRVWQSGFANCDDR